MYFLCKKMSNKFTFFGRKGHIVHNFTTNAPYENRHFIVGAKCEVKPAPRRFPPTDPVADFGGALGRIARKPWRG